MPSSRWPGGGASSLPGRGPPLSAGRGVRIAASDLALWCRVLHRESGSPHSPRANLGKALPHLLPVLPLDPKGPTGTPGNARAEGGGAWTPPLGHSQTERGATIWGQFGWCSRPRGAAPGWGPSAGWLRTPPPLAVLSVGVHGAHSPNVAKDVILLDSLCS